MDELVKMVDIRIICGFCGLDLSANAKFEGDEIEVEPCAACIAEARADAQEEGDIEPNPGNALVTSTTPADTDRGKKGEPHE